MTFVVHSRNARKEAALAEPLAPAAGTTDDLDLSPQQAVLVALGNRHRQDDAVGLYVAHILRERKIPALDIVEEEGDLLELLESWGNSDLVILVDAVSSGSRPGTVHHFEIRDGADWAAILPQDLFLYSTHGFGLAEVVGLAEALGAMPRLLVVYGIEGAGFEMGRSLSLEALAGAEEVARDIMQYIKFK